MKTKIYSSRNTFAPIIFFIMLFFCISILHSQTTQIIKKAPAKRIQPVWWVGESLAGNLNYYRGTTQNLNESVSVPTAFHNGEGYRLYFSFLAEYRPNKVFGAMLNVAFNNRSSSFDGVITPDNKKAFLYTVLRYVNIEPSLRIAPFSSAFYLFGGPSLSINSTKEFFYEQEGQHETRGNWGDLRKYVLGAQAGAGIDIPISKRSSSNQLTISPFVSYQTNLLDDPRKNESWNIYSFRSGVAVKFGTHKNKIIPQKKSETNMDTDSAVALRTNPMVAIKPDTVRIMVRDIQFSAQNSISADFDAVNEIFPLRNSIFFNAGTTVIPERYVQLTPSEARNFKEEQLQKNRPANWYNNRSQRQLAIYHNILNIIGDRMRNNPQSTIVLSSGKIEKADGAVLVGNIKSYLVTFFGIDAARISESNTSSQFVASIHAGDTNDPELRHQDDRRVDITTNFPQLLMPFNSNLIQDGIAEQSVTFTADGAGDQLQSWSIDVMDNGSPKHYGPFTQDKISLPVKTILADKTQGDYTVQMSGLTKDGQPIRKQTKLTIVTDRTLSQGLRYAVLFDFDKSNTLTANKKFLEDVVAPQVTDSSTVIIHGHTDIIGDENYNRSLSGKRVREAREVLEQVLSAKGRKGIKFEYYGFGKDEIMSPFNNRLPEERFYNRTVVIDIIKGK